MKLLSNEEIQTRLSSLPVEWSVVGGAQLQLDKKFNDFAGALAFVNEVGAVAEEQGHHPDIQLGWGKAVINSTTHDVGGLTEKDFALAKAVSQIS